MTAEEVDDHVLSLPGCKRKGSKTRPAWYVRDRLVARMIDPTTVLVRVPQDQREALIERFPNAFGIPPRFEAHHKIEVYLDQADTAAVIEAIRLAWEFQLSW